MGEAGGAAKGFEVDESAVNLIVKFSSFCGQGRSDSLRDEECGARTWVSSKKR